ncbi:hypothetical protein Tsubulata_020501 [Turnera subulata]|uniref:Uncharacterized protein n=1 Tax=Turnera subulata TaxID=218843 RepID=A0A9Q0IZI5_9ROSI|nr:hypothetical protein Tsubulata_020501 [Turnera subulata]
METNPPANAMPKKLCKMMRVLLFMIQKGVSVSKTKFPLDLHLMIRRGKILGKALNDLVLEHQSTGLNLISCRSRDAHMSFVSPREYEFSCSNSPAARYNPFHQPTAARRGGGGAGSKAHHYDSRKYRAHYKYTRYHAPPPPPCGRDDVEEEDGGDSAEASPLVAVGLGQARVRQVRITDSPFSVRDADVDCHVDKEAEKFIARFYRDLRLQKWMAGGGAPDKYCS